MSAPFGMGLDISSPSSIETFCFDTHTHGRDGEISEVVAAHIAERCCGAILEPNTNPRLSDCNHVITYLDIFNRYQPGVKWVATIDLSLDTDPNEVLRAWKLRLIAGVKWYPPGHQQADDRGVTLEMLCDPNSAIEPLMRVLIEHGIPLMLHGEVKVLNGIDVDPYDQEAIFVTDYLDSIRAAWRELRISLEHISTEEAVEYMIRNGDPRYLVCTVTAHHLCLDRRWLYLNGFLRPDHHCLPVIKDVRHQQALHRFIRGKYDFVLAGTDLAPHDEERKHGFCCWGGMYTGHCSVELYAQVFDSLGVLDYLDQFLYWNAKRFHNDLVPDEPKEIRLVRKRWTQDVPFYYGDGDLFNPFGYFPEPKDRWQFTMKLAT